MWEIYVIGPPDTPYHKGIYKAHINFPDEYPMKPPTVRFLSKMFHPNIYKDGKVCISTLQTGRDGADQLGVYWRPVLGIEQVILSVVSLLSDPNLDDPANTGAANLLKKDKEEYRKRCEKLALKSLSFVPEDFELPEVDHRKKEDKKEVTKTQAVQKEEDDWRYSMEDLSTIGSMFSRGSFHKRDL